MAVADAAEFFSGLELDPIGQTVAAELLKEIRGRLGFLVNVGLEYLTLDRTAPTLSGGESQRIRLAGQIGCGLVGVLYILDEPSIGLHPRDNRKLLETLTQLRDKGNTVLVVEHDEETMRAADQVVDFGPGPGVRGGRLVAQGSADEVSREKGSVTGQYLSGKLKIEIPAKRRVVLSADGATWEVPAFGKAPPTLYGGRRRKGQAAEPEDTPAARSANSVAAPKKGGSNPSAFATPALRILGAKHNSLPAASTWKSRWAHLSSASPAFPAVDKSSLVGDILVEALRRDLNGGDGTPGAFDRLEGLEHLDKLIAIDQSPIGRTPRLQSRARYIKVFDDIRDLYARLPESKHARLPRAWAGSAANAQRGAVRELTRGTARIAWRWIFSPTFGSLARFAPGSDSIARRCKCGSRDKASRTCWRWTIKQRRLALFENDPATCATKATKLLHDVGLDYLHFGQPSPAHSRRHGEAQRIKLARELVKRSTGRTLYLLDEPTTGLHFADIKMLLKVLHDFADAGNTVLVVEHNLDVVKTADWIIDLGPEGGAGGGLIIAAGTPEEVAANEESAAP